MYMFPPRTATLNSRTTNDYGDSDLDSESETRSVPHYRHESRQPSTIKASYSDGYFRQSRTSLPRMSTENISFHPSSSSEVVLTPTTSTLIQGRDILGHTQSFVILDEARAPPIAPNHTRSPTQTKSSLAFPDGHSVTHSPISISTSVASSFHPRAKTDHSPFSSPLTVSTAISSFDLRAAEQEAYDRAAYRVNRLPNRHLDMDLKTLNLHLSTRVTEILACTEAMWSWVVEFQTAEKAKTAKRRDQERTIGGQWDVQKERLGTSTAENADEEAGRDLRSEALKLTRSQFDRILSYFEM